MRLTMTFKELLSNSRTKHNLTILLAIGLLDHFASTSDFKLIVVYDNKIKGQDFEEEH